MRMTPQEAFEKLTQMIVRLDFNNREIVPAIVTVLRYLAQQALCEDREQPLGCPGTDCDCREQCNEFVDECCRVFGVERAVGGPGRIGRFAMELILNQLLKRISIADAGEFLRTLLEDLIDFDDSVDWPDEPKPEPEPKPKPDDGDAAGQLGLQ